MGIRGETMDAFYKAIDAIYHVRVVQTFFNVAGL